MDETTVKAQMELASTMRKNCFQFKHKLADGSIRDVEVLSGPISMNGRMLLYSIIFDITERNRTEIRLRESEARFRNLVEVVPVPIYIQCDRRFVYLNPAALKNLGAQSPEQLLNQAILERFPPSLQPLIEERMRILNEQRQEVPLIEETMIKLDGTTFPAEVSAVPFQYEGQDGALVFFRDITERQRLNEERLHMERQILQTQKLESLGVLAGGIAHDFNNILMAVLGHADLALHQLPPFSPVRSNLQEIENASHRAADLCRQMLAYSGKGRFIIETFNLRDLIEEMVHLLQTSISKKAILNLNLEKNLPPMHGDATQIRQIIMNLVINASEAIGDRSGVITISTGAMLCSDEYLAGTYLTGELPHGLYVWLEVSDTGCGMDAATQNRIFEPFFTTKFTGRGLGMAAVMGIVRGHQGALKVYSEVNRGTTFKVLFPAVETDSQPGAGEGESQVQWQGSGTVLLADDEETIRALGTKMLERLGFKTLLAADGCEAVELYTRHRDAIKLVLLDLTMPHMSGDEAFRELRQIDPDVCVILSSGYTENEIASRFAGKGISGFIQKPYNLSTLQTRLREALANQPCSLSEEATGQVTPVD